LGDKSGYYIASAGDYNNDTYQDLLVSATYAFNKVGAVYLITNALASNTRTPTSAPNFMPKPSKRPSSIPTVKPSRVPSVRPSKCPTLAPTSSPTTILPTLLNSIGNGPTSDPSIDYGSSNNQPSGEEHIDASVNPTYRPSRKPSLRPSPMPNVILPTKSPSITSNQPSRYPTFKPSNTPTYATHSLSPLQSLTSNSPSLQPTSSPTLLNDTDINSMLNKTSYNKNDSMHLMTVAIFIVMTLSASMIVFFNVNFRCIYKLIMDQMGYEFRKSINDDTSLDLRIASLEECIQHFWEYRGDIYKKGTITDDLFIQVGSSNSANHESTVLNALEHICINPNLLCRVSYYKVVCHMADRKSKNIRNKANETLLKCKSVMDRCVTVESIQLLRRMFIDSGRIDVKENVVHLLCEITKINSNMITFDIYDMLRSYKMTTSDMSLSHAIDITLQEIRQHCVHLHTEIDEYEKSLLTTCYNNCNDIELVCRNEDGNAVQPVQSLITMNLFDKLHMGQDYNTSLSTEQSKIMSLNDNMIELVSMNNCDHTEDNIHNDYSISDYCDDDDNNDDNLTSYNIIVDEYERYFESIDKSY
jgi:hypothetical protein